MRKKHRIIAVTAVFTAVVVGGGGAVIVRQQMLNRRAQDNRALGMVSIESKNYKDALHQLGSYLQRYGQEVDAEALFEYARSRRNVPLPNGKHIGQAIGLLLQVLSIDPGHREARLELLDLYSMAGYGQETLDLAKKVLDSEPENVDALRAEARALARMRKFDEALIPARHITQVAPQGTEDHLLVLALMDGASAEDTELLAYPESQEALDRGQSGYHVVRAVSLEMAGQRNGAVEAIKRAAEVVQPGSDDVMLVNNILTQFGLYGDSLNLLARTATAANDPGLLQFYCQRLFEVGNTAEVLKLTEGDQGDTLSSGLLAIRGMAAGREGNKTLVEEVVGELKGRTDDTVADAWEGVLEIVWLKSNAAPKEVMDVCAAALNQDQANPYFHYLVGLAHEKLGERDNALASLQNAVKLSPAWIDPILKCAGLFASGGQHGEALVLVQAAMQRAPQNVNVAATGAEIISANLNGLTEPNQAQLLKLCEQVQSVQPLEPRTLPILIHLRALQGDKAGASQLAQSALQGDVKLPEGTLLKLAQLSDQYGLELSEACFAKLNSTGEITPSLAYAQATSRLRNGDAEGARAFLADAAAKAGGDLRWQAVMAQFLELSGSDDALAQWVALAEKAPDDAGLLRMILDSRVAWKDLGLIDRVIERLKGTTGENAVNWRVARARWMMLSDTSPKAAAEAAGLLNDTMQISVPEASRYALLATALKRLNNVQGAIESLEQAAQIAPENGAIHLELADLFSSRGDSDKALAQVDSALANKALTEEARRRAAMLLARGNEVSRAIEVLQASHDEKGDNVPLDLQLAQLYRRAGQLDKAEAIFKRYLAESPNEFAIALAADLFATQGRKEEALAALQGLDALELKPGQRPMLLAEYHRIHGAEEETARWYEQGIAEAKTNPEIWRRQMAYLVQGSDPTQAIRRIPDAVAACPDEPTFKELVAQVPLMEKLLTNNAARPFILSAIEDPGHLKEAVQGMEAIDKNAGDGANTALALRRIVDEKPEYLPAQIQLVRIYSGLSRHGEAAEIAARAMRNFPGETEPAMLAAQAYAAAGNWTEALTASRELRRRAPNGPQAADFMIANAQIQLGQPTDALETIQPYAEESPENPQVLSRQAQALIAAGRADEAEALLRPRMTEPGSRMAWVELATLVIPDETTAARWLNDAASAIPVESLDERGALALAWYQLSDRFKNTAYRDQSRDILETLAQRPDVTADLLFRLGMVYDVSGVYELAEANYQRAITLAPDLIAAKNNLAMRYITSNKNLNEALKLAEEAATTAPNSANIQDTLAQAQAALGDYDAALNSLKKASELEPGNRQWTDRMELLKAKQVEASPAESGSNS